MESVASGVRKRAVGEDEDAEAVVRSADKGSRQADPSCIQPQVGQIAENGSYAEVRIRVVMSTSGLCCPPWQVRVTAGYGGGSQFT